MKDESSLGELEYCPLCRFPLVLLKIRTPTEHIQNCKARILPKLKCSEGIYCRSRMESHYQLFLHEDPPRIGAESASTKTENLNNNSSVFPTFIDLTDSQNSSEDFAMPTPSTLKNRSNFLKASQLHKSKLTIPSKTHKRKRRISKNSSMKQENKLLLNNSTYEDVSLSQLSAQTKTPFTIALQQRRNLQKLKSKVNNHDSIDLTQDGEIDEDKAFLNNKSNLWKHSKIVDLCDSSSSETEPETVVKPFVTLSKSLKKLKRPFLSSTQRDSAASSKRIKLDLSAVIESPITAKQGCFRQTHDSEREALNVEASCQNMISSKNNYASKNDVKISDSIESNGRLQFSASDSTKYPHFQSTQISDTNPQSSVPASLETLDSEDLPTLPPRGPGFVPMTPIAHDKFDNHGHQTDTDAEEDLFSMSPFDKPSNVQFIDVVSHPNQADSSPKGPGEKTHVERVERAAKITFDRNKSPIEISFDSIDHHSGAQWKEDTRATRTKMPSTEAKHDLQVDYNEEDSFHLRPLDILVDESLNETVLSPNEKNPPSRKQPGSSPINDSTTLADKADVEMQGSKIPEECENIACQSFDIPTPDAGLSFSESDQDEYNFLDFASADNVPFTGPPNVLKEQQRNSSSTDNNLVDRMDNFECSSVILHDDSRSFHFSSPSDVNNNRLGGEEKQSADVEHIVADGETPTKRQEFQSSKSQSAIKNPSTSRDVNNNLSKAQKETISSIVVGEGNDGIPVQLKSKDVITSRSTTMENPSNTSDSIREGSYPNQPTDDSPCCGSDSLDRTLNSIVQNPAQSKGHVPSPLPKNFLLESPEDVRVVQKHPIRRKILITKCTRMLNFDSLQDQTNHAINKSQVNGCGVNGSKLANVETGQSGSTVAQPTEGLRISTNGGAQNKNSAQQHNKQIPTSRAGWKSDQPVSAYENMRPSICKHGTGRTDHKVHDVCNTTCNQHIADRDVINPEKTKVPASGKTAGLETNIPSLSKPSENKNRVPASWSSNFAVSPSVAERECVDQQMHSPARETYESACMSMSDLNDSDGSENLDAVSNSTKRNDRLELRVRSNIQRSDNIQSDESSYKSSLETLPKESTVKRKKQGDIGAMLFGMKPKVQPESVRDNSRRYPNKRFRDGYSKKPRYCPFYKKIAGTDIAVDAFSYGPVPGINVYFLSHFHFDHYAGLERGGWTDRIFCGQVTGNLLAGVLRIPEYLIVRLPLWEETPIGNVSVTLLDANHCPGAVLLLFKLRNNTVILHTGDFRATPEMEQCSFLNGISINTLHLDTTYLNPEYCFPRQSVAIEAAVSIVMQSIQDCPKTLFVVGSYDIGKERIFCGIAKALNSSIYIVARKMNIIKCLESKEILNLVTTKRTNSCKVHVVPMRSLNIKHLKSMLSKHRFFDRIVAIKPTGWTQESKIRDFSQIKPDASPSGNVKIYGLPYSEHSSFEELRRFVQFIKPKRVIPTVNVGQAEKREAMNFYLNVWKDGEDVSKI